MGNKEYSVVISDHVKMRMEEHFCFLANINPKAAKKLLTTFVEDMRSLRTLPSRNPRYESSFITGEYRFMMCAGRYRIIYLIEDSIVYVDEIFNCRLDEG